MSDPQIPASLSPVVIGVKALHNFFPEPMHHMGQTVQRDAQSGKWARPAPVGAVSSCGHGLRAAFFERELRTPPRARPAFPTQRRNSASALAERVPYLVEDVDHGTSPPSTTSLPLWNASSRSTAPARPSPSPEPATSISGKPTKPAPTATTTYSPSATSLTCPPATRPTRPNASPATASPSPSALTPPAMSPIRPIHAVSTISKRTRSTWSGQVPWPKTRRSFL